MKKFLYRLFFISFLLFLSGCVTTQPVVVNPPPPLDIQEKLSLKTLCDLYQVQWSWDSVSQVIVLNGNHQEAKGLVGSNVFLIGDESIELSDPVEIENSSIMVPLDFKRKIMLRLASQEPIVCPPPVDKIRTVIIDPGHGGKDPGAIGGSGLYEKDVVLDISQELADILSRRGFNVEMTRTEDDFISLEERTEFASRKNADFFISIHANSSKSKRVSGIEVFSLRNLSYSEMNSEQRKRNQYLLFQNFSMTPDSHLKSILSDLLYDHKCCQDDLLAAYAVKKLSKYAQARNRGEKKSGFFVLKNTIMPSILVEIGFLSNPREERLLQTKSYRKKIARSLAQVIIDYNRLSDEELCRIAQPEY